MEEGDRRPSANVALVGSSKYWNEIRATFGGGGAFALSDVVGADICRTALSVPATGLHSRYAPSGVTNINSSRRISIIVSAVAIGTASVVVVVTVRPLPSGAGLVTVIVCCLCVALSGPPDAPATAGDGGLDDRAGAPGGGTLNGVSAAPDTLKNDARALPLLPVLERFGFGVVFELEVVVAVVDLDPTAVVVASGTGAGGDDCT